MGDRWYEFAQRIQLQVDQPLRTYVSCLPNMTKVGHLRVIKLTMAWASRIGSIRMSTTNGRVGPCDSGARRKFPVQSGLTNGYYSSGAFGFWVLFFSKRAGYPGAWCSRQLGEKVTLGLWHFKSGSTHVRTWGMGVIDCHHNWLSWSFGRVSTV